MIDTRVRIKHMAFHYENEIEQLKSGLYDKDNVMQLLERFMKDFKSLL